METKECKEIKLLIMFMNAVGIYLIFRLNYAKTYADGINLRARSVLTESTTTPFSFTVLTSGCSKSPPNFSYHRYSRTSMWTYPSDTPYSVQLFVQPIRFVLQFLLTLFLNVLVFIVQTFLRPAHSGSSGMRCISLKVRRIPKHKFAPSAHYRTRHWNTCLPCLRPAALPAWY